MKKEIDREYTEEKIRSEQSPYLSLIDQFPAEIQTEGTDQINRASSGCQKGTSQIKSGYWRDFHVPVETKRNKTKKEEDLKLIVVQHSTQKKRVWELTTTSSRHLRYAA